MMLASETTPAHVSGKTISTNFGIGNAAILVHYMTNTIYSNKPKAICQEIMSNSRDAHLEIGTPDLPIQVKVPNALSPNWECKDFGPGIDPDRMHKVFTQYANSTKRTNNTESGGWGLGGKTPFAYADTFTIRTIAKEDGVNTLRNYVAIKEGDAGPRLLEVGEPQETQEVTGTTISVPIKPDDFSNFASFTFKLSQFWTVRPTVLGTSQMGWETYEWNYEGANWKIGNGRNYYKELYACIDGIPYTLNASEFSNIDSKLNALLGHNVVMFFKVGDLNVTLNREQLDYTDKTKKAIINRLEEMQGWLENEVEHGIAKAATLWEAHALYNKLNVVFRISRITDNVLWNNIVIDGKPLNNTSGIGIRTYREKYGKLRSEQDWGIQPNEDVVLVLNDDDAYRVDIRKIQTIRDLHPKKTVTVISPNASFDQWKKEVHWDLIKTEFINLSTILPKKVVRAGGSRSYSLSDCRIYDTSHRGFVDCQVKPDYKHGSGVYIETLRKKPVSVGTDTVRGVFANGLFTTESVYQIPQRFVGKLGKGWISFNDAVKKAFDAYILTVPHIVAKMNTGVSRDSFFSNSVHNAYYTEAYFKENLAKLIPCKIVTWYKESKKAAALADVDGNDKDVAAFKLLARISNYDLNVQKVDTVKPLKDSVNMDIANYISDLIYRESDNKLTLAVINFLLEKSEKI